MLKAIGWFRVSAGLLVALAALLAGLNIVVWTTIGHDVSPLLFRVDQLIRAVLLVEPDGVSSIVASFLVLLFFAVTVLYFASGVILLKSLPRVPKFVIVITVMVVLANLGYCLLGVLLHGLPGASDGVGSRFVFLPLVGVSVAMTECFFLWVQSRRSEVVGKNQEL